MGTVEKTIASLEGRCTMTDKERFEGMKARAIAENEEHYGAEVRRRHGDAAMDAANERMAGMTEAEWNDAKALEAAILEQLVQAKATGDPTGEAAQELCAMHARWLQMHCIAIVDSGCPKRVSGFSCKRGEPMQALLRSCYNG